MKRSTYDPTPYEVWCRDAMLPHDLVQGEHFQSWGFIVANDVPEPWQPGWNCDEVRTWRTRDPLETRTLPGDQDHARTVWVPDESAWLDRLTSAGYDVSCSRPFDVVLVALLGPMIRASGSSSWAHGLALCWAQTPEGLAHFEALEVGR